MPLAIKYLPQTNIGISETDLHPNGFQEVMLQIRSSNRLPLFDCNIFYSDDIWDFTAYKKVNVPDTTFKFIFTTFPSCFLDIAKTYAFLELARNEIKIQTITGNLKTIARFLQYQFDAGYIAIEDIPLHSIESFLDLFITKALSYQRSICNCLSRFLHNYSAIINPCYIDPQIFQRFKAWDSKALVAEQNACKLPDIPKKYFNRLLEVTLHVISSDNPEDVRFHHIANMLLLLMQTGLRIGELFSLTVDCLQTYFVNGKHLTSLTYTTWKRERGTNVMTKVKTFVNELAEFAVKNLISELKETRDNLGVNYLFVDPYRNNRTYPIDPQRVERLYFSRYYCYIDKYMPTINVDPNVYPELHRTKLGTIYSKHNPNHENTVIHPVTEQYRVRVCTELYERGVSLEYIMKYMGHLSHHMTGYYARPKVDEQEDKDFSRKILSGIVSGQIDPLGGKVSLSEKINEFIAANKFNVSTDLDQIVDNLMKQIPIRQKAGGVCIKSSMLRDCSVDAETNEFYCAYNVCPNIYHFFYMADYSYQQVVDLRQSIDININYGFLRQAEKERNMLRTLVKQKLLPELESLKKHIDRDGVDFILSHYPNLSMIVEKFDEIYKEALNWTTNEQLETN